MTANVLEHRRAKAFAEALEAHQTENGPGGGDLGGAHRAGSTAMAELLSLTDALDGLPRPQLAAETRAVQRAQLMAAFEQAFAAGGGTAAPARQRRHRAARGRWGRRLAIGGLVAGVAVGSFAGAAAASGDALPGDALYGMKRGLEGLRLDWAGSDSERGALLLQQASTRLDEAQVLLQRSGDAGPLSPDTVDQVRRALDDMHAEAVRGRDLLRAVYRSNGSLAPMRQLAGFAEGQDQRWAKLHSRLPGQLSTQADRVDALFDDISEDVAPLHLDQPKGGQNGSGAVGGQGGDGTGQGQAPGGASAPTSHGTGGATGGGAPSGAPNGVGGLVDGLTTGLGAGQGSPAPGDGSTGSGASPAPSGSATPAPGGQGITIPPLIPGLLPGLTLGG
ncbi:DUF5667 domain-containing protein [Kitasatospora sp. NPDC059571]|uniref:DUF5667 domain-containing protein n=1 Tax=Kitasatospora sp. NPDC059571 TaxID=3346871 RepID=UPI0036B10385